MKLARLVSLAVSAPLLSATPAIAQTWVMAAWEQGTPPKPGTIAAEYNWHGMAYYIDLRSVVAKGNFVYYYDAWIPIDHNKRPVLSWDRTLNQPKTKHLRIANCKTLEYKPNETSNWKAADPAYRPLIKLACEK